jgi:hypothetical protein
MRHEKVSVGYSSPVEQVDMLKAEQNSGNPWWKVSTYQALENQPLRNKPFNV